MSAIPRDLELLSQHLGFLLGREYQALSIALHALRTKEERPALEKDEQLTSLAILSALVNPNDAVIITEWVMQVVRECYPIYHSRYEANREAGIRSALQKVKETIDRIHMSDWSKRDLVLAELRAIAASYEQALAKGVLNVETRIAVAILELGYYSVDINTARRLLCINAKGEEERANKTGAHAVCAANGVHYKPDPSVVVSAEHRDIAPIAPGKEYAVSSLMQLATGGSVLTAAPTGLLIMPEVPLERADIPNTKGIIQAGLSIQGLCLREFLLLRQALRFFKKVVGDNPDVLVQLLLECKNKKGGFSEYAREKFADIFLETTDFSLYAIGSIADLKMDLAAGGRGIDNKIYIHEEDYHYAWIDSNEEVQTGELPPELDLSNLNEKLEDVAFRNMLIARVRENDRAARSDAFRKAFERICAPYPPEMRFLEIEEGDGRPEFNRARIFRNVYEKYTKDLPLLKVLVGLTHSYPHLMHGQSIAACIRFLKTLDTLFELFPQQDVATAIEEVERVLSHYLDKEAASTLWLVFLLTLAQDNKTDNFRLMLMRNHSGQLQSCSIVCIDNDMGLEMPFNKVKHEGVEIPKLGLTMKNSLFWLDELLDLPLHPQVRMQFLSRSAHSQWVTWLCLLLRRNQEHAVLGQQGWLWEGASADFPIKLPRHVLEFILEQWRALQESIQKSPDNPQSLSGTALPYRCCHL